ncbi:SMC-Scp complex subunit ScpB [Ampullimonas aquatilis]|uniref:SMC-Scp complex subunit ScpB n=1 Tax=Ampullimonas aquatilis TaxID=1341549 RepID=UPI003C783919
METAEIKKILEAVLLCADGPLSVSRLMQVFDDEAISAQDLGCILNDLADDWRERGVQLVQVSTGWRFQSVAFVQRYIERLKPEKPAKYTRAVLETLAIIAYKQPVTRGDIEEIRGVTVSSQIIKVLEDRGWIEVVGHRDTPGRPALFVTTEAFLDDLALTGLSDIPLEENSGDFIDVIQATMQFDVDVMTTNVPSIVEASLMDVANPIEQLNSSGEAEQ